jgi:hypothetical protein
MGGKRTLPWLPSSRTLPVMAHRSCMVIPLLALLLNCDTPRTYAKQCSAPLPHWRKPSEGMNHHAVPIRVRLDQSGTIFWNGTGIDERTLGHYMEESGRLNPVPFPLLLPDAGAPCRSVQRVRALMDERLCNIRWACGEGHGAWQSRMDLPPPDELRRIEEIADHAADAAENSPR